MYNHFVIFLYLIYFITFFKTPTASHSLEKRDHVINELVETEKNYIDVITTLQRCFMRPLQNVLKEEDFRIIFMGVKVNYFGFSNL